MPSTLSYALLRLLPLTSYASHALLRPLAFSTLDLLRPPTLSYAFLRLLPLTSHASHALLRPLASSTLDLLRLPRSLKPSTLNYDLLFSLL